jgi:hypothetical protein
MPSVMPIMRLGISARLTPIATFFWNYIMKGTNGSRVPSFCSSAVRSKSEKSQGVWGTESPKEVYYSSLYISSLWIESCC